MVVLKKILVATDFSVPSQIALEYGRHLARTFNAGLRVVHVVENMLTRYGGAEGYVNFPELQQQVEEAARHQLAEIVTDDDRATIDAQSKVVASNSPARAVVEYARDEGIDLIVVGTHGRGGVSRVLLGSIAERVVRTAPCPVLTVHDRERDFLAPDALAAIAKT